MLHQLSPSSPAHNYTIVAVSLTASTECDDALPIQYVAMLYQPGTVHELFMNTRTVAVDRRVYYYVDC